MKEKDISIDKTKDDNFVNPQTFLNTNCGDGCMSYQYGNYINALEEITSYFQIKLNCQPEHLAECLELYAKHLKEGC